MKDFKTDIKLKGDIEDAWASFTNPFTIEIWSGYPCKFEAKENTEFELFEGDICGMNVKIDEKKELVQEWYFGEQEEKSIVSIKFFQQKKDVRVIVNHTNIPDEAYEDITYGWKHYFLIPIKELVEIEE